MQLTDNLKTRNGVDSIEVANTLLRLLDDGIWLWNITEGKYDAISPTAQYLFSSALDPYNQDPEKWVYKIHPDDRQMVLHATTKTLFKQLYVNIQYRIENDLGNYIWITDYRKLIKDDLGKPHSILGRLQDITKQKKREEYLEDSEISLKIMFLQHPSPMYIVSCPDGRILEANQAALKKYGYSHSGFTNLNYANLLSAQNNKPDSSINNSDQLTTTHVTKSGKLINVMLSVADYLYRGKHTKLIMALDISREIADEKEIKKLSKRLSDFRHALTSSTIVSITNRKGIITYVNQNFLDISGYTENELIGSAHNIINSGYHPPEFFKDMWRVISKGQIWRNDIRNRAKDGSYYWVDTYIVPVLNDKGIPEEYISIRNDITHRQEVEEELADLNKQLEERIKKRTQALEQANSSLQDFAYSISHDLRAPVRHINCFAKIVFDENQNTLNEESLKYQRFVIEATNRLSEQIEGLLQFSRVGSKLLHYKHVDPNAIVERLISQCKINNPNQRCEFTVDKMPIVNADEVLIEQVFSNLISNAIKYSSKRDISKISIHYEDLNDHHQFAISDNGVGFDMIYAPKLFGMFSRLHSQSEFEGNGIGLVNVKRIVERHDGRVWVNSKIDEGATFYFTISKNLENEFESKS